METREPTYRLTGITADGGTCDCCGRRLKNVFEISNGQSAMTVGRACCKKLTGWTPQMAQALAKLRDARMFVANGWDARQVAEYHCNGHCSGQESLADHVAHGERSLSEARRVVAAMGA